MDKLRISEQVALECEQCKEVVLQCEKYEELVAKCENYEKLSINYKKWVESKNN